MTSTKPCFRCRSTDVKSHVGTYIDQDTTMCTCTVVCHHCGAKSRRVEQERSCVKHPDELADTAVQEWNELWETRPTITAKEALENVEVRDVLDWMKAHADRQHDLQAAKVMAPFYQYLLTGKY
jgi:hypothetical protein